MSTTSAQALPRRPFSTGHNAAETLRAQFQRSGASVLLQPALDSEICSELAAEASRQRSSSAWHLYSDTAPGEIRQDNMRGYLGPCARALLSSAETLGLLQEVTHLRLEPAWSASCYTYYDKPGSCMGEHCDKFDACRIAFLFYLDATWPQSNAPSPGLQLHVFRGDNSRTELLLRITARSNRAIILNGAEQAHYRPPLAPGESLIMLAGCFRLAG
jgi:hypothetical protein